tara:strand:+ start:498 stop:635 length:138 start_codon:yes stop_codon:yes gene_type:complete
MYVDKNELPIAFDVNIYSEDLHKVLGILTKLAHVEIEKYYRRRYD